MANAESKKGCRRKRASHERTYPNPMRHTDCRQRGSCKWSLCHEDDAPRFVAGHGVFENATAGGALKASDGAIRHRGKPASTTTDHGSRFHAGGAHARKGASLNTRGTRWNWTPGRCRRA